MHPALLARLAVRAQSTTPLSRRAKRAGRKEPMKTTNRKEAQCRLGSDQENRQEQEEKHLKTRELAKTEKTGRQEQEHEEEEEKEHGEEEEEEEKEGPGSSHRATAGNTDCEIDDVLTDTEDATAGSSSSPSEPLSSPETNKRNRDGNSTRRPSLPPLAPQTRHRWPRHDMQLPPSFDLKALDPLAAYSPTIPAETPLHPGLSARMWWAIYLAWRQRWGSHTGMSQPLLDVISIYVRACLFQEETVLFLAQLQLLIFTLLPSYTVCPSWLWWMLYGRRF